MGVLDDYLASLTDPGVRAALEHVRDVGLEIVPDADQGVSYRMAALTFRGKGLLAPLEAKTHLSVFPFSGTVVSAVAGDLAGYSLSTGTIRFTVETPLPDAVLRRVVELRRDEIDARTR